jgi:23S rRNA pseudouridine1911/1915/1917 synthase
MTMRKYIVTRGDARRTVAEWLHHHLGLSWSQARQLVRNGHVTVDARPCRDSAQRLQRGQRLAVEVDATHSSGKKGTRNNSRFAKRKATRSSGIAILFADAHVVVVEKPAGLTTMRHSHEAAEFGERGRRFLPTTLEDLLPGLLPKEKGKRARVIAVHRLDKETSGLIVFARTPEAARHLGKQMRAHTAERRYLALVRGQAKDATLESWLVRDRGDGRRGSGKEKEGQKAVTHVRVVELLGGYSLVECRLETGRTHQVRIHLGEMGTPLCGERIYDRPPNGRPLPDGSGARRIALHAVSLEFEHPTTGRRMHWTSPLPGDMKDMLERLRNRSINRRADRENRDT